MPGKKCLQEMSGPIKCPARNVCPIKCPARSVCKKCLARNVCKKCLPSGLRRSATGLSQEALVLNHLCKFRDVRSEEGIARGEGSDRRVLGPNLWRSRPAEGARDPGRRRFGQPCRVPDPCPTRLGQPRRVLNTGCSRLRAAQIATVAEISPPGTGAGGEGGA